MMKISSRICMVLPLLLAAGCVSGRHQETATYTPLDAGQIAPTSDRDQSRIYAGPAGSNIRPSPEDIQVAQEIHDALMQDTKLASEHSNFTATARNGVVTLQGKVATPDDKQKIYERIVHLPGVSRVDDQLEVKWYRPN